MNKKENILHQYPSPTHFIGKKIIGIQQRSSRKEYHYGIFHYIHDFCWQA